MGKFGPQTHDTLLPSGRHHLVRFLLLFSKRHKAIFKHGERLTREDVEETREVTFTFDLHRKAPVRVHLGAANPCGFALPVEVRSTTQADEATQSMSSP